MEYQIAAIPTVYNGIKFRSRLEARWAAFFDRVGLKWQYEPFDLGSWSPDFLIEDRPRGTLVEVKPITEFDVDVATRAALACYKRKIDCRWFVILGIAPTVTTYRQTYSNEYAVGGQRIYEESRVQVGWIVPGYETTVPIEEQMPILWMESALEWLPHRNRPEMVATWCCVDFDEKKPWTRIHGINPNDRTRHFYPEFVQKCWADACNTVQWQPKRNSE